MFEDRVTGITGMAILCKIKRVIYNVARDDDFYKKIEEVIKEEI